MSWKPLELLLTYVWCIAADMGSSDARGNLIDPVVAHLYQ